MTVTSPARTVGRPSGMAWLVPALLLLAAGPVVVGPPAAAEAPPTGGARPAAPAEPAAGPAPAARPAATGPERWAGDMAKFRAADEATRPTPGGLLFVGSSSIRLWETDADFPERSIVNRGFGGSTIPDVLAHFETLVTPHKPSRIVFYCGENDLAKDRTPEQVAADFRTFVHRVRKLVPGAKIAYLAIKPSNKRWALWPEIQEANALVRAFCEKDADLTYLDTAPPLLGEDGKPNASLFRADQLHLAPEGYARWNALVEDWLASTDPPKAVATP